MQDRKEDNWMRLERVNQSDIAVVEKKVYNGGN